jgi:RNA polymerase sigma-70 factor (ECF subfamily)
VRLAASDDIQLMGELSDGSVEAFGELYDRFCNRAYGVAFSVCRDQGRAQDAVQEAFLSLWKSQASYRPQQGAVAAWVLTVVRYRAIDIARRNGNHAARWAGEDQLRERPAPGDTGEKVIQRDDADRLRASLALLPADQQEVITLAYYGQLSHTEIATRLGLPPGTVKGRLRLGLQKLRASIEPTAA